MNLLKEQIIGTRTMSELDELRMPIVQDRKNMLENQQLFIKQKNKIKRHGGRIND